eukprot:scaffold209304_cov32-Tisochrysis_lutea.AAC.1
MYKGGRATGQPPLPATIFNTIKKLPLLATLVVPICSISCSDIAMLVNVNAPRYQRQRIEGGKARRRSVRGCRALPDVR